MKTKTPKILFNGTRAREGKSEVWVKAWKDGREYVVQVWLSGKMEGDPDGDWFMPGRLGFFGCLDQAVAQTTLKGGRP